jgi:hypothetical protein
LPSPPLTDHVTGAGPPLLSVAVNCSTDAPFEFVALQPVQFVSMVSVPGEMEKLELLESAVTGPAVQPASMSNAGAASIASALKGRIRANARGPRNPFGLAWGFEPFFVALAIRCNVSGAFWALNY